MERRVLVADYGWFICVECTWQIERCVVKATGTYLRKLQGTLSTGQVTSDTIDNKVLT